MEQLGNWSYGKTNIKVEIVPVKKTIFIISSLRGTLKTWAIHENTTDKLKQIAELFIKDAYDYIIGQYAEFTLEIDKNE